MSHSARMDPALGARELKKRAKKAKKQAKKAKKKAKKQVKKRRRDGSSSVDDGAPRQRARHDSDSSDDDVAAAGVPSLTSASGAPARASASAAAALPVKIEDWFAQLQAAEARKPGVGTIHAEQKRKKYRNVGTGNAPRSVEVPDSEDEEEDTGKTARQWQCANHKCGHLNHRQDDHCAKCGSMRRLSMRG